MQARLKTLVKVYKRVNGRDKMGGVTAVYHEAGIYPASSKMIYRSGHVIRQESGLYDSGTLKVYFNGDVLLATGDRLRFMDGSEYDVVNVKRYPGHIRAVAAAPLKI